MNKIQNLKILAKTIEYLFTTCYDDTNLSNEYAYKSREGFFWN